ncbi:hypothetical protein ASG99_14750 [Bacillus sp. Soil768D1]|nr:hypothetical protein ASG99_14750 [Bacillus sp. Soil768D1]
MSIVRRHLVTDATPRVNGYSLNVNKASTSLFANELEVVSPIVVAKATLPDVPKKFLQLNFLN